MLAIWPLIMTLSLLLLTSHMFTWHKPYFFVFSGNYLSIKKYIDIGSTFLVLIIHLISSWGSGVCHSCSIDIHIWSSTSPPHTQKKPSIYVLKFISLHINKLAATWICWLLGSSSYLYCLKLLGYAWLRPSYQLG